MGLRAAVLIILTVIRLYELKKLAKENFSEPALSPLPVRLQYSHPPLGERIAATEKKQGKNEPAA